MGRRLSDDFPYIGYVHLPSAVTGLEYNPTTDLLTLTNANGVELQTEIFVPSEYVHKISGEWDPQGTLVHAFPTRTLSGTISDTYRLTPDPVISNIAATSMAATNEGIPITGSGVVWSKFVVPTILPGDNIYSFSVHIANSSSSLLDQMILLTGSVPPTDVWGVYAIVTPSGFNSYSVIGNHVTNHVSDSFITPLAAGDEVYVGLDYDTNTLLIQKNSEGVLLGSPLTLTNMPSFNTLYWAIGIQFTSNVVSFDQSYLQFTPGAIDSGKTPFVLESDASAPIGAAEGMEYKVISSGRYNGYALQEGDFVSFYNGINDLKITRIPSQSDLLIPPGVVDLAFDDNTSQLILERLHPDGSTDTLTAVINATGDAIVSLDCDADGVITLETDSATFTAQVPIRSGFVAITDITPQSISDNVSNKVVTDDGYVLQSCVSNTVAVRVHILSITGSSVFKPSVTVNGTPATLTRASITSDVWTGYADILLAGVSPYTVTATHADGPFDSAIVTLEDNPVIDNMFISGAYPSSPTQIQHAAGQIVSLTVESSTPFKAIELVNTTDNAFVPGTSTFALTTSKTITVSVADRGTTPVTKSAVVRIQNANNTWSAAYSSASFSPADGVGTLQLNNARPSLILGTVTYPASQQALKSTESATVSATYTNVDSVVYTSPNSQLSIAPLGTLGDPVVTRIAGGYNITNANLQGTVYKISNATTSTATKVVQIADTPVDVIAISKPSRLRSGPSPAGVNHTLNITLDQKTQSLAATVDTGSLQGSSWSTSDEGLTYSRQLKIVDSDPKRLGYVDSISVTNLAGIVTTHASVSASIRQYVVGGFIQRTVYANPWVSGVSSSEREADIGTQVRDVTKLVATIGASSGVYTASLTTYTSPSTPANTNYAITGPSGILSTVDIDGLLSAPANLVFIRDTLLASGNTSGTLPVIIEELI